MLEQICAKSTTPPSIVPGTEGDLGVEWHTENGDLVLHVLAPNDVQAWCLISGGDEESESVRTDFSGIVNWVSRIFA